MFNYSYIFFSIVVLLTLILYGLLLAYMNKTYHYWKVKNIPIKKPEYLIGNIIGVLFGKFSSTKYITKLCCEFPNPYFVFFVFYKPFLVVKEPTIIKRILVTDFQKFSDKIFINNTTIDPVFSDSILSLKNPHWKYVRTGVSKVFSPSKVKGMMMMAQESCKNLRKYLETISDESVNVKDVTTKYTTDVISNYALGINPNSFTIEQNLFVHYANNIFPKSYIGIFKGFTYVFLPQIVKTFRYQFFDETSTTFFRNVFLRLIEERQSLNIKRNDLIDVLLNLKKEEDNGVTFDQNRVLAQAVTFLGVGHDTLSAIVALTIYQLSINDHIQSRLRDEINTVIDQCGKLTIEALENMKFLQMIIWETLRMYPVIQFIQRRCVEDCLIPETGVVLEKGTPVIIPTYWLHFNESYFPNPYDYNPERFNEENKHKIDPYVFLPFSAGPRSCLGKRFALMNLKICIIFFVKCFRIEQVEGAEKPLFGFSHTLEPKNGIFVKLVKI
ncbi:hypothetical protein FQR65_LT02639 [Abscondita terminalis]|nr:hypothetical protein FQR65_LT02639 [Abscondita terminalis]